MTDADGNFFCNANFGGGGALLADLNYIAKGHKMKRRLRDS